MQAGLQDKLSHCRWVSGATQAIAEHSSQCLLQSESHSDAMLLSIMKQAGKKQDPLALNDIAMPVSM